MDYYNKYCKYKTKYLNLKYNNYQYGGVEYDTDHSGIIRHNILNNVFAAKQENYSIEFNPFAIEMIFIFGDKTGHDFFKRFQTHLNMNIPNPQNYTESKRLIITSINTSPDILWKLFFKDTKTIDDNTKDNIISILNEFINRYCNICFEPTVKSLTEIYIIPNNTIINNIFTALFSNIKRLLGSVDSLYSIISEYLFFNLLSHYFLDYQVNFTNYYKDFHTITLSLHDINLIGIIVNAYNHKLCLFTCNNQPICYNYTRGVVFVCDWVQLLADPDELYITPKGELISKQTYNAHMQNSEFNQIAYDRVLYITVLTKWESTDVPEQTTFLTGINLNIMHIDFADGINYIASMQDKVMQYILAERYINWKQYDISFLEKNDFIPAQYILGDYYIMDTEFKEQGYKIFTDSAPYKYPLTMERLCWYNKNTPSRFPNIIISKEVQKWCTDKNEYLPTLNKMSVPSTTKQTDEEKQAMKVKKTHTAAAAALKKTEEEAIWKAEAATLKAEEAVKDKAEHSKIFICIPNLEGTIENLDLCEASLLENK